MTNADVLKKALLHSYLSEIFAVEKTFTQEIVTEPEYDEEIFQAINEADKQPSKKVVPKKFTTILIAAIVACITMILTISSVKIAPDNSSKNIISNSVSEIVSSNERYQNEAKEKSKSYSCNDYDYNFFYSSRYQSPNSGDGRGHHPYIK